MGYYVPLSSWGFPTYLPPGIQELVTSLDKNKEESTKTHHL